MDYHFYAKQDNKMNQNVGFAMLISKCRKKLSRSDPVCSDAVFDDPLTPWVLTVRLHTG